MIEDILLQNSIAIINHPSPTHLNSSSGTFSTIDLSLCSQSLADTLEWDILPDTHGSDHFPIILRFPTSHPHSPTPQIKWNTVGADWTKFNASLSAPTSQIHEVDTYIQEFSHIILKAAHEAIPSYQHFRNKTPVPWWNSECSRLLKARKKALNLFKRHPTEVNFIEYKRKRAQAKRIFKETKIKSWRDLTSSLRHPLSSGQLWQLVRKMKGTQSHTIPSLLNNDIYISDPKEIINAIAHNYQTKSTPKDTNLLPITTTLPFDSEQHHHYNFPFSMQELNTAISSSKNTAPGPDSILLSMIQHLSESMLKSLLDYYNHLWCNSKFPASWLHSIIVPIHKAGKPRSLPNSYRPISLTNHLCKILERMVHQRLTWVLETKNHLSQFQYGFRKHRSAIDHLASLDTDIRIAMQRNQHTCLASLDLSNAFDITNGNIILEQLNEMGFTGALPKFIKNFLSPRTFQVRANGLLSNTHILRLGVPQGSVLSPTLFNIAIQTITKQIPTPLKFKLFADDIVIYHSNQSYRETSSTLQTAIASVNNWAINNDFNFSPIKSKTIHICKVRNCLKMDSFHINNNVIPSATSIKILGLTFDNRLCWNSHIKHLKVRTSQDLNILRILANTNWGADFISLNNLYKSLILAKLRYGDFIYDAASIASKKSLDPIQNQALRLATGAFRTTPINSLQCIAATPPLFLTRQLSLMKYYSSSLQRPHTKFSLNLTNAHKAHIAFPPKSIPNRINSYLILHGLTPPKFDYPLFTTFPPWFSPNPSIDLHFHSDSKNNLIGANIIHQFSERLHTLYSNFSIVFTDGSKTTKGVGAAFLHKTYSQQYKLPPYTSIFSAELLALKEAIRYAINNKENNKFLIASDSLSAIKAIKHSNPDYAYSRQIADLLYIAKARNRTIIIIWIPSHMGIKGNDRVDQLAKQAIETGNNATGENHTNDFHKNLITINRNNFQLEWDLVDPNNKLWEVKSSVFPPLHIHSLNRSENVKLRRLATGHTYQTHSHLLKSEPAPLCTICNQPLTVKHIFEAPHFSHRRNKHNIPSNIKQIVSTFQSNKLGIINYLKELNIVI